MWRRALKVMAVSYAVKSVLVLGIWLAAPDLVKQGRDKVRDVWASMTRSDIPAAAAIAPAAPHQAAGEVLRPIGSEAPALPPGHAPRR
jgi:hypothetical protein